MDGIKLFCSVLAIICMGCDGNFVPRPKGYPRIDLPLKNYNTYNGTCPFKFDYPDYCKITKHQGQTTMPCWLNMDFIPFKGRLHISYLDINSSVDLEKYLTDTRSLAYKHIIKAHAIDERLIINREENVYGIAYDIKGANTASSLQFYLTDSSEHFLRGALYFSVPPNNDSLSPVISFITKDVNHLLESFRWK